MVCPTDFSLWLHIVILSGCVVVSSCRPLQRRSDDTNPLEAVVTQQGQTINELKAQVTALTGEISNMKAQMAAHEHSVVFMTALPSLQDLTSDPRVRFGTPSVNVGGGYHEGAHSFVAPVSGLYVFFLKATGDSGPNGQYMQVAIMKEGQVIAETEINDNDDADRSSVQTIVQLHQGDSVWVQKTGGEVHRIWGGGWVSAFGGFLLKAGDSF